MFDTQLHIFLCRCFPFACFHSVFQKVSKQYRDICAGYQAVSRIIHVCLKPDFIVTGNGCVIADDGIYHMVAAEKFHNIWRKFIFKYLQVF